LGLSLRAPMVGYTDVPKAVGWWGQPQRAIPAPAFAVEPPGGCFARIRPEEIDLYIYSQFTIITIMNIGFNEKH